MAILPTQGTVQYGTFSFPTYTTTEDVSITPVLDAAKRTIIYNTYSITLRFIVTAAGSGIDNTMQNIRNQLTLPAQNFYYQNKGLGNLTINVGTPKDVMWGPIPKILRWKPKGQNLAAECTWQVEFSIPEPCFGVSASLKIMELAYKASYAIDDAGYTRRTYSGFFRVPQTRQSPGSRALSYTADQLRETVVPDVPVGFRRTSQNYTIDESKCRCDFEIVDEDLPAALPPGVVHVNASHQISTAQGKLGYTSKLISTITADYEMERTQPRSYAWKLFLDLVSKRFQQAQKYSAVPAPKGGQGKNWPFLLSFSLKEPDIYGRNKAQFAVTYTFLADLQKILAASGLFQLAPGVDANLWKISLANSAFHPRGFAKMGTGPESDAIVDLCSTSVVRLTAGKVIDNRVVNDLRSLFPCPPPSQSYLHYELKAEIIGKPATVEMKPLPSAPVDDPTNPYTTYKAISPDNKVPDFAKLFTDTPDPYPMARFDSQPDTDVQTRNVDTVIVVLTGSALRVCYEIEGPPELTTVWNVPVIPYDDGKNYYKTWLAANLAGNQVAAAHWRKAYLMTDIPPFQLVSPPNPYLNP